MPSIPTRSRRRSPPGALSVAALGVVTTITIILLAGACEDSPSSDGGASAAEERTDELRDRVRSFQRENARRLRSHQPDTGLELPGSAATE